MLFSQLKDKQLRQKYLKVENKLKISKFLRINILSKMLYSKKKNTKQTHYIIAGLRKKTCRIKTKILRRSIFSDHTKSNYRQFNMSRFVFRDLLRFGLVPGYRKAVW